MKTAAVIVLTFLISIVDTCAYAITCNCDDWAQKGGYCVDYIKRRIPEFPLPDKEDMPGLKNTDVSSITKGDVAVFKMGNFWHVAYVENVRRNAVGEATAIDVSEMNFGRRLSFHEFKSTWKSKSRKEWKRAAFCCGITDNYGEITSRRNIDLGTVTQVWSPDDVESEGGGLHAVKAIIDRARKAMNDFFELTEGSL